MKNSKPPFAYIVTPRTFVVSKSGNGEATSAFACLSKEDSVIVEIVTPTKKGPCVILAHLNSETLEHPTTLALLKAARLCVTPKKAIPFCRVYSCSRDEGHRVLLALKRETGLKRIHYRLIKKPQDNWVGLDMKTGLPIGWRKVANGETIVRALHPKPDGFGQRLKTWGYKLRDGLFGWAKNPLYADGFPKQNKLRKACGYEL